MAADYQWKISNVSYLKRMTKKAGKSLYCARCGARLITCSGENVSGERILQFTMEDNEIAGFTHDSCAYGVDRDNVEEDVIQKTKRKKSVGGDYYNQGMARLRAAAKQRSKK